MNVKRMTLSVGTDPFMTLVKFSQASLSHSVQGVGVSLVQCPFQEGWVLTPVDGYE